MPVRVALGALLLAVAVEAGGQGDRTLPSVISKGAPQYTEEALNARVVGQVWLSVTICRAVAWLELAQEQGVNDARVYLRTQALPLSGDAKKKIKSFKKRFGQPD